MESWFSGLLAYLCVGGGLCSRRLHSPPPTQRLRTAVGSEESRRKKPRI